MEFEDVFFHEPNIFTPSPPLFHEDERHCFWKGNYYLFFKSGFKHLWKMSKSEPG